MQVNNFIHIHLNKVLVIALNIVKDLRESQYLQDLACRRTLSFLAS